MFLRKCHSSRVKSAIIAEAEDNKDNAAHTHTQKTQSATKYSQANEFHSSYYISNNASL